MRDVDRQLPFDVRLEWGLHGVQALAPDSDAIVVVDVLSFSSAVDVALSRDATVFPYRWADETAAEYAEANRCVLAGHRGKARWSLSPQALQELPKGIRIVLPSPNGSTLSIATGDTPTFTGCLRNAKAVARAASKLGSRISVIPAGEMVDPRTVRFALEDYYGAAAILSHLEGSFSPEARAAVEAFEAAKPELADRMRASTSGRELIDRGYPDDVEIATQLNASPIAPRLTDGAYRPA